MNWLYSNSHRVLHVQGRNPQRSVQSPHHGNSEEMIDVIHNFANTKHTTNLVPLYIYGIDGKKLKDGKLCDIAPTILDIMGYVKPKEMTGKALLY